MVAPALYPLALLVFVGAPVSTASVATASAAIALSATATPAPTIAEVDSSPPQPPTVTTPVATASSSYELTVVGTRLAETGGSAHILDTKKLEALNYDDPHAVLAAVPGVYSRGEDGVGLRPNIGLRGVNPDRSKKVTLLEDGILFGPAPYSAPAAYYFPLITRMSRVRVIKGPGAVSFGPQTIAGAIDLVTRPAPARSTAAVDLAGGAFGYKKAHGYAGAGDDKIGVLIEAVHIEDNGFKALPNDADTGFYRNEVMLKGRYLLHAGPVDHHLGLKLTYSDEMSNETYLGLTDADLRASPNRRYGPSQLDRMTWHRISGVVSDTIDLTPEISWVTTAYRHDLDRIWRKVNGFRGASLYQILGRPDDPESMVYLSLLRGESASSNSREMILIGPNQRAFVSEGIESRIDATFETGPVGHRFEAGARLHYDRIERRHSQDAYAIEGSLLIPEGSPTEITVFNEASTLAGAFLVTDAIEWQGLTLTPGVRVEILRAIAKNLADGTSEANSTQAVLPGIAAYYALHDSLGILAGVHRGFSPPAPGSEAGVKPEYSINYEAGARYSEGRSVLEVVGFYNDYSNLTDVCTFSSGCVGADLDQQFNAGEARIYGVEADLEHRFAFGELALPLTAAYTFTRATFDSSFESEDPIFGQVTTGDEIPYVPRHTLNASLGVDHPWGSLIASLNYVAAMREEAGTAPLDQSVATEALLTVDAGLELRPLDFLDVYLNVRNVFDTQVIIGHRPFGARPNAPRWIQLGLRVASF